MADAQDRPSPRPSPRVRVTGASLPLTARASRDAPPKSRQREPFRAYYQRHQVLEPPFSYEALVGRFDQSDVLQTAVAAMETNVVGHGLQFVPVGGRIAPEHALAAEEEKARLARWFRFASGTDSFTRLCRKTWVDYEVFGDGYWELLRSASGALVGIEHMRAFTVRKGPLSEPLEVERWVRDASGAWVKERYFRRFRKYLQWVDGSYTWFKEWGDPRPLRWDTGEEDPSAKGDALASEVLNFCQYAPDSVYGKPRWRGAACDVAGRTAAAEINSDTFDNNAIPPLLILVMGALLGQGAVDRIREHFAAVRGRQNRGTPLVIEAAPETTPTGEGPTAPVKIAVEDLTRAMQSDALFSKYRQEAAENIGMTFRLSPIVLGRGKEYNRATAESALTMANEQVFAPERAEFDERLNRELLPELGAVHWEVRSNSPPLLSWEAVVELLRVGLEGGTLSPSQVAEVLEPLLGLELSRTEAWAKLPTSLLKAMMDAGWRPQEALDAGGETTPPATHATSPTPPSSAVA